MNNTKLVTCIRRDLKMRRGKEIAQGGHGCMSFLTRNMKGPVISVTGNIVWEIPFDQIQQDWLDSSYAKICVRVDSEAELLAVHQAALDAGIVSHLVQDAGRTEFGGVATFTCCTIGPDTVERIDKVTGHLELY